MATLAFGADIPPELISIILSHIHSRKHLVRISLVSRAWQRLAFPALWHEVQITAPPHMEQLVSQLQSEPNDRGHCISQHLNLLFVRLITDLDGDLLARFQQIIPKMAFLKHLTWEDGSPNAVPVLRTFQQSCGALRSVDLDLRRAEPTGTLAQYFQTERLTKFKFAPKGDQESVVRSLTLSLLIPTNSHPCIMQVFGFRNLTHIILPAGMLGQSTAAAQHRI